MERIGKLCTKYGLGNIKGKPQKVTGGLLHTMYRVSTDSGDYAVKQLNPDIMKRPKAMQNMVDSERISDMLSSRVPVASAKKFCGEHVIESEGFYYLIYDWLEGKSVFAPDITEYHCEQIGRLLGIIHSADISVESVEQSEDTRELYAWDFLIAKAEHQYSDCYTVLKEHLPDIKRWDTKAVACRKELLQNQVISHRDLDPKNVMWNGEQPCLIDWEAAGYINPYQELVEVLHYWIVDEEGAYSKEKFDALMQAYKENCSIVDVNWEAVMFCSFDGMLGWLAYNVKRALRLEGSKEADQAEGMQQVRDTMEALKKYEAEMQLLLNWIKSNV